MAWATLGGVYPVVSYDFALLNQCWFKGKYSGKYDSSETYPLLLRLPFVVVRR